MILESPERLGGPEEITLSAGQMSVDYDVEATVDAAYAVGREGSIVRRLSDRLPAALQEGVFEGRRTYTVPVVRSRPELTTAEARRLKPTERVGRYRTRYVGTGGDEQALKENAAIHLKGTGFPWEEEANVYIAGHRLGYPNTDSFLAFFDLNKLEKGDRVFVTDSEGKRYIYRVFEEFVVKPTELHVTQPVPGKNVLTLQTCTLPNYSERSIVRAELMGEA